jgi:hypothetical protein
MAFETSFRFESGDVSFELAGPEEFVRANMPLLLPFVKRAVGQPAGAPAEAAAADESEGPTQLKDWYAKHVQPGTRLTMQDHILVFALWMRSFKKYIFTSESIRRAFDELDLQEPKSLLQILGTLKRDHNLILGTERRGEYMLNTTGIERARRVLGLPAGNNARGEA